jgi:hypothetical protein
MNEGTMKIKRRHNEDKMKIK